MAKKNDVVYGVVEGVIAYAKLAQPDFKYQSKDTEYSISIIVDEDRADEWNEQFKKQPATKVKVSEFEAKFKTPLPESLANEKNVYVIKLKKDAVVGGEEFFPEHRPKVLLDTNDGERVEITTSRLIANGSYGKVSYRISSNDFGTFARLNNVLMDEEGFIEYESKGGGGPGSEFGDIKPVRKEADNKSVTEARKPKAEEEAPKESKKETKKAPVVEDDLDQDCPF